MATNYITTIPFQKLIIVAVCLLFFSCAQVVSPGGGPKDTEPPVALKFIPDSASTNFNSNSFSITFNEYVQLKDLNSQLVVSPLLKKTPEIKIKNKTMVVTIEDTLKENTTYTFNFGSSIRDITEDNYKDGFRYIFSTGDFLDSLTLKGKAEYAFDHKTEKGILVMLYDELYDSLPYKKPPSYFAKTREDGSFAINNIKAGKYKVVALKDANANYLYDNVDEESIGFLDEPIHLQKDTSITISLFKEVPKKLFLKRSAVAGYGHLLFIFNRPVEDINIQSLYSVYKKQWYIEEYSKNRDSLHLWLHDAGDPDSLSVVLSEKDKVIDTLFFNLLKKEDALNPKKGRGTSSKLSLHAKANINDTQPHDINEPIIVEFNHPIFHFEKDSIEIIGDSLSPFCRLKDGLRTLELTNASVSHHYDVDDSSIQHRMPPEYFLALEEGKTFDLFIPPNTFTDIFNLKNDTINVKFTVQKEKYYGNLKLKLIAPQVKENIILQLLGEKGEIIQNEYLSSTFKDSVFTYTYLQPQKYKFKIIYDANKNGKWDTGNYLEHQQPEKVIFNKEEITIRSNWDQEVEWNFAE